MRTLETERLTLRPFANDDMGIHEAVFSDPEVCKYYCGKTRTEDETREWLIHRKWQAKSDEDLGFLAVVRKSDNRILGLVALQLSVGSWLNLPENADSKFYPFFVELSYAIGREYQRQGYATEACKALIKYGFREMRLPRLTNGVSAENIPTNRLCQTLGFQKRENPDITAAHSEGDGVLWILENTLL